MHIPMIEIRKAHAGEYIIIANFQQEMAMETENLSLDPATVRKGVMAVFDDPSKGCYYVAEYEGKVAGSLLTTYEWSDWRNSQIIWIQSVFILPEFRNKGIYKMLYQHIKQLVQDDPGISGIRLYVDKSNHKAAGIYRHCGMDGDHYQLYEWINFT
ncbi:MAG: GNAT family N-acetyltransferase [Bacteroidales bacterium]